MQTQTTDQKVVVRDGDGNFYSIPEVMHQQFVILKEAQIGSDFGSDEWQQATQDIATEFSVYMKD